MVSKRNALRAFIRTALVELIGYSDLDHCQTCLKRGTSLSLEKFGTQLIYVCPSCREWVVNKEEVKGSPWNILAP